MAKVVQIGASRNTRGGVTTVLKSWENSEIWHKYDCKWLETQDNRGILYKFYYLLRSFFTALLLIPKCDIAHFHTVPGMSIIIQMPIFLLCLLLKKRIVVQLHVGNQIVGHTDDTLFKWVLKKADRIVVLAFIWKDLLLTHFDIPQEKVSVIYNAAPDVKRSDDKEKYVLFMAYLVKNKGYDILIKAFSEISHNYPDWNLIIAGTGEMDKARELAKRYGVEDKIVFKDWVIGAVKDSLWKHAGAYCMASYQEGFPMTVLEAWSYGTPLITTPVGGLPDVIRNRENALVFDFGDVDGLANCFSLLFSSDMLQRSLSEASVKLAKTTFSMEHTAKDIERMYESL